MFTSSLSIATLSVLYLCRLRACCGICEFLCVSVLFYLEGFLGIFQPHWLLCPPLCLLFHKVPEPWGEGFNEDNPLRTEDFNVSRFLNVVYFLYLFPFTAGGSFFDDVSNFIKMGIEVLNLGSHNWIRCTLMTEKFPKFISHTCLILLLQVPVCVYAEIQSWTKWTTEQVFGQWRPNMTVILNTELSSRAQSSSVLVSTH